MPRLPSISGLPKIHLRRIRRHEPEPRVGEPVDSSATHLERLVLRLGLAGLLAALLFVFVLDEGSAAEVALGLANMGVVVVASWRFGPTGRWTTVLLAGLCWTAASELSRLQWPPAVSWWDSGLRLGVLVTLAGGVGTFKAAIVRLLRTEDVLAATVVRERDSARRDRLTRLWNSRYLHETLEQEIARCRRYARPFGLLLVDLDGFKAVNDAHGHLIGDEVLVEASQRIARVLRPNDTVARLGGDEFAVLCEELGDDEDAGAIAERIVHSFGEPFVVDGREVRIGASVGIATVRASELDGEVLLDSADQALYEAKNAGRGRWQLATP